MNRRREILHPQKSQTSPLNGRDGSLRHSINYSFLITLAVTLIAASLSVEEPRPLDPSIQLKVLADPDGLLELKALPPTSNAWVKAETLPIEHRAGVTWVLLKSKTPQTLEIATGSESRLTAYHWPVRESANAYAEQETSSTPNTQLSLSELNYTVVRIESESTFRIAFRHSTSDEIPSNIHSFAQLLALLTLMGGFILLLSDTTQLLLLRSNWTEHANNLLISAAQFLVIQSQPGLGLSLLELDIQTYATLSWTLLGSAELLRFTSQTSSDYSRKLRNIGFGVLIASIIALPVELSLIFGSIMVVGITLVTTQDTSIFVKVYKGTLYTLLALSHTALSPTWSDDKLELQTLSVFIFVALAANEIVQLVRTYARQKLEFEQLQYRLKHEHTTRLYITSSTAHELNNPINFISSGVGLQLEQFGELRDLVDSVFYEVEDPDAVLLKDRFDSTLRSILNITLDIQAGALRSAASLDHLRGLSPANNEIVSTFCKLNDILQHALDRVELQYQQSARAMVLLDLSESERNLQFSTNRYFLSDAVGKLFIIALSRCPPEPNVVRAYLDTSDHSFYIIKISYPGELPSIDSQHENTDRLDQLEHISQGLRLIGCQIACTYNNETKVSTLSVYTPKLGASK